MVRLMIHICLILWLFLSTPVGCWGDSSVLDETMTLQCENISLRAVLNLINQKKNIHFIFSDRLVNDKTVDCNIINKKLKHALDYIFSKADIAYREVDDRRIVLYQSLEKFTCVLTGTVVDSTTNMPLHYANVFLSRTTWGAATFDDGSFKIDHIPLGTYDLVVSMMGYQLESRRIELSEPGAQEFNFYLKPIVLEAPGLQVTGFYPRQWAKHLDKFIKLFLGTSDFASECRILNPEVLEFEFHEKTNSFTATASEPLQIENRALGYHIIFHLKDFTSHNDLVRYMGEVKFIPLTPQDLEEEKKWEENRLQVYKGSFRHFFAALGSGNISEEDFFIFRVPRLPQKGISIFPERIDPNSLITPGEYSFQKRFSFTAYLKIIYVGGKRKIVDSDYWLSPIVGTWENDYVNLNTRLTGTGAVDYQQTSWLRMNTNFITITTHGYIDNPYAFTIYGSWAWERLAEELPWDYLPEQ